MIARGQGYRPPRLALRLLELFVPAVEREAVIGDLVEAHSRASSTNRLAADLRFWRETVVALVTLQFVPDGVSAFTPHTRESIVQSFVSDLRHAIRVLSRARGFTVLCVATLGIAIGATTAIFSVVNPVLLNSLPYPDAKRLVLIGEPERDGNPGRTTYATFLDLRRDSKTLERSAVVGYWDVNLFGERDAERMLGERVTWEYFRMLGARPMLGRDFREEDDTPANSAVVILSHGLWTRRFGGDSGILGRVVDINGLKRTVIGVMPRGYEDVASPTAQIWRPLGYAATDPSACRTCRHLVMLGRIKAGVPREQAARELDGIGQRLATMYPRDYPAGGMITSGLQQEVTRNERPVFLALLGAVLLVLLIAVANVVNLQLARAVRRHEEFAVRAALGAGRWRLTQQLLAEGLVLAVLGGVAGIAIAALALPVLVSRLPEALPRLGAIRLDWQALGMTAVLVLLVAAATGVVPALQAGRRALYDALRGAGRALGGAHQRARAGIVVGEMALATMLLIGAGLLGRSLTRLLAVNTGFDASHLVTMEVQATGVSYAQREAVQANHDRLLDAVRALPGVESAALATQLPLGGNIDRYSVDAQDKPLENPELAPYGDRYTVTPDFQRTMRIPMRGGRWFTDAEVRDTGARVAVVSEALARRIWPGEDAVGKYVRVSGPKRPWWRVIGIAGDIRHTGLDERVSQQIYMSERQWWNAESAMVLVVRTKTDPRAMVSSIRDVVRSVDPLQPISRVATMEGVIVRATAQRRLGLLLFVAFGGMALMLAAAGIYGVLAGSVEERTREFGLRSALGAAPVAIARLILQQAAGLAGVGLTLGAAAALLLSRYLRALLFGVGPNDPATIAISASVILVAAIVACLVPARRAIRVDPMTALRSD